jgi:hypothetical protein
MLKVVSTVDTADILQKSPLKYNYSVTSPTSIGRLKEEPSAFELADNNLEGGSTFIFDGVPTKNVSGTNRSRSAELVPPPGTFIPAGYHYNPKVSSTVSIVNRSDRYRKRYAQVEKAKLQKKNPSLFYWQAKKAQERSVEKMKDRNMMSRLRQWSENGKPSRKPKAETKRKKKEPPSWYTGGKEAEKPKTPPKKEKVRKQYTVLRYEKKMLVDTTWVDGGEAARVKAGQAVALREMAIGELEQHMIRARVDGVLYMNGPKNQFSKYLKLFKKITSSTIAVCEAIQSWRSQLHSGARINYQKSCKLMERPQFTWSYMRQLQGSAGKKRTTVNYMKKMLDDMDIMFLKGQTEILGLLGHEPELLLGPSRAGISANFIMGVPVCPLLLPCTLQEIANGATPRDQTLRPLKTLEMWPKNDPAIWYGINPDRVRFAAQYLLEEEEHELKLTQLQRGTLDALSTVLKNGRAKTGRYNTNTAMSDLLAKNMILNGDVKVEPQVGVALTEITRERLLQQLQVKLEKAKQTLREAVGDSEIVARKARVDHLKFCIERARKQLKKAKRDTVFVPVKD